MAIYYKCRHCQTSLGAIDKQVSSDKLGFDQLTSSERAEMVTHDGNGDLHVEVICEDCHEALMKNPQFYEIDQIIQ